jgi:hypothetical protein
MKRMGSLFGALFAITLSTAFVGHEALADHGEDDNDCKNYAGNFTSTFEQGPGCTNSPVLQMCTHGLLDGGLAGTYEFGFLSFGPAGDPTDPTKFLYTGQSVVTLKKNGHQLFGHDTGVMHINPVDLSAFVTTVSVIGGTKDFKNASGQIVASGALSFATGLASGSYTANICKNGDDDHGHDD